MYLLDSCTFLWMIHQPQSLSAPVADRLKDASSSLGISVITIAELALKQQLGKLHLTCSADRLCQEEAQERGLEILPFDLQDAQSLAVLPLLHRDPFDRMLVAQAQARGRVLLTPDAAIHAYSVKVLW